MIGASLINTKKYPDVAIKHGMKMLAFDNDFSDMSKDAFRTCAWMLLAEAYRIKKMYKEALKFYEPLIHSVKNDANQIGLANFLAYAGECNFNLQRYDVSLNQFREARAKGFKEADLEPYIRYCVDKIGH